MDADVSGYVRRMTVLARHARNVFLVAVVLSGLLALNVTFLRSRPVGSLEGVRLSFGPLLLWALTAAAHAFNSLSRANAGLTRRVGDILEAEQARGLRQLTMIKSRLRQSKAPDPE